MRHLHGRFCASLVDILTVCFILWKWFEILNEKDQPFLSGLVQRLINCMESLKNSFGASINSVKLSLILILVTSTDWRR